MRTIILVLWVLASCNPNDGDNSGIIFPIYDSNINKVIINQTDSLVITNSFYVNEDFSESKKTNCLILNIYKKSDTLDNIDLVNSNINHIITYAKNNIKNLYDFDSIKINNVVQNHSKAIYANSTESLKK